MHAHLLRAWARLPIIERGVQASKEKGGAGERIRGERAGVCCSGRKSWRPDGIPALSSKLIKRHI